MFLLGYHLKLLLQFTRILLGVPLSFFKTQLDPANLNSFFRIPLDFKQETIFLGFALQSFAIVFFRTTRININLRIIIIIDYNRVIIIG